MLRRVTVVALGAALAVATGVATALTATAVTANVQIVTTAQTTAGQHTITYNATATSSGTVSYVDVSIPSGTGGWITSPNGSVRTVSTGVLRWKPSTTLKVSSGYRFTIAMSGFVLPSGLGPWNLWFKARSTAATTLSYGTAYTAAATVSASSPVPGTTTSLRYVTKVTKAGTMASVRLYLPSGAAGSMTSVNGTLTKSTSYVTWTPTSPISVSVGSQISITVNNVQLSKYGGVKIVAVSARTSTGTILANASGRLALIAPPASMPAVPVTAIASPPPPCPDTWDSVAQENAKPGTGSWVIPTAMNGPLSAYLTRVSATCGQSVDLKVDSGKSVTVTAYRMGYYQGSGGARGVASDPGPHRRPAGAHLRWHQGRQAPLHGLGRQLDHHPDHPRHP